MIVEGASVRSRLLSPREAARLMGLSDDYLLPGNYNDAYGLMGDGVVVPVVRFLAEHILEPVLQASTRADPTRESHRMIIRCQMKGQSKPCWTPFPISTIIVSRTGCRTMDIGSWLRSLGLGQYEAAFRDNPVDAEVLFELSDGDLAQLGVLLGGRKRLLKAMGS